MGEKFAATVLLENPVGENFLTYEELVQEVRWSSTQWTDS